MDRRRTAWVFAALFALLVGVWLVAGGLDSDGEKANPAMEMSDSGVENWHARLVRRAALISPKGPEPQPWPFAAMQDEPEAMPPRLIQAANATLGRGHRVLGLRFDRAQYVDTTAGIGIWVVRGKGVTCIFHARTAAAACSTDAEAGYRGMILVVGDGPQPAPGTLPTRFLALGIAPNLTRAVRLEIASGASKTVPIIDNAFALRAREPMNLQELID
jgi:hypothetical protein